MLGVSTAGVIASSPGQSVVVSQFNMQFRDTLGLSASTLSAAYMIGTVAAALPLVYVGKASDRFGPRRSALVITLLFALACASVGLIRGIATLTLAFFLLRFLGQGSLSLVSGHMLALWFERRLGFVNGAKLMVSQLGFATVPAIALWLIDWIGWQGAYLCLGAGVLALMLPLLLFVARDKPEDLCQQIDNDPKPTGTNEMAIEEDTAFTLRQALLSPAYWTIVFTIAINGLIGTALIFHCQPLLEWLELDATESASVLRTWSLTVMVLVFPSGWLADHLAPRTLLTASAILIGAASVMPLFWGSLAGVHAAMVAFAASQSLVMGAGAPTIARYFGRAHHGAIRAVSTKVAVAGTGLGPIVLGLSLDLTGSMTTGLVTFGIICVPVTVATAMLRPPRPPSAKVV